MFNFKQVIAPGAGSDGSSIFRPSEWAGFEQPAEEVKSAPRSGGARLSSDIWVYLVLALLTWGTWELTKMGLFTAGDDLGYWIGVAGGVMMVLLFSYPLRKHFRFMQRFGKAKWWFLVHMLLGVGGPMLILLHSTFQVRSLNAAMAFYSMLIVAISGVIGRFIYVRVNRGLHGEQSDFRALEERAGLHQKESRSRLRFAPTVEKRLLAFGRDEVSLRPNLFHSLRRVFWMPIKLRWVYWISAREVSMRIDELSVRGGWDEASRAKRCRLARKLVKRYLNAVLRVSQFTAYERLFSLWHVAHIPFVYLLILSAVVHVVAVHAY